MDEKVCGVDAAVCREHADPPAGDLAVSHRARALAGAVHDAAAQLVPGEVERGAGLEPDADARTTVPGAVAAIGVAVARNDGSSGVS
ncbi:MAG: hypothetical protein FJ148_27075 [Deltaproteobacteria bacterium]|nr:hypothetical protein [Deltaproteobacteria bacterium]